MRGERVHDCGYGEARRLNMGEMDDPTGGATGAAGGGWVWYQRSIQRDLLRLAVPSITANLAVPLLGVIDTIVLGRLPDVAQLGAAATAGTLLSTVLWVFGFLRMGTVGLVAQAYGQGDETGAARVLLQGLVVGALIGAGVILLQWPVAAVGFAAMGADAHVEALARAYFGIRIYEAPFALMFLALTSYLRGIGDARTPMVLLIAINVVNITGDLLLVPGWGGLPSFGV
ncbi:MAG TPA: MATE family efflux transporter, partial [Limnochordia bacterium]|nr:MATE family efflux transporter [Limnochordia bacterium]